MADNLVVILDLSDLINSHQEIASELQKEADMAIELLTAQTHSFVVQEATQKLHSRQSIFLEKFPPPEKLDDHSWVLKIPEELMWIEEGLPSNFDMLPGLLQNATKTGPGGRYKIIPFKHNKSPSKQTALQRILTDAVKKEMASKWVPYQKIEKNPDGSPKKGLLHKFDINGPNAKSQVFPPQIGPQGRTVQAHPKPQGQEGPGGRPYLWATKVYQKQVEDMNGQEKTQKDVMTFRTASEKQSGKQWIHPGLTPFSSLDKAQEFAENQIDGIIDGIMRKFGL